MTMWNTVTVTIPVVVSPGPVVVLDANVAAIITALALLVTSISGLVVAWNARKESRTARTENAQAVQDVHTLVNSHASDQAREIASVTRALARAGITIPEAMEPAITGIPPNRPHRKTDDEPAVLPEGMELTGTVTGIVEPVKKEKKP